MDYCKWIKWRLLHLHASCLALWLLSLGGLLLLLLLVLRSGLSRLQWLLGVLGRLIGLALLVDGHLHLVLVGRNLLLCLFEVRVGAVGTGLHLVEVELHIGGVCPVAVLVRHFLDFDGLASHIVVLLLFSQLLLEVGIESADCAVLVEPVVRVLLSLLTTSVTFRFLLLLVGGLLLVTTLFLTLCLSGTARHELHASLLNVHLQQGCKLATVGKLYLLTERKPGVEHSLVVLGDRCLADSVGNAYLVGRNVHNLVGESVDADEVGAQLACAFVGKVHDLAEVAVLQEVLLVLWGEGVTLVSHIEFRLVAHEMRHKLELVVIVLSE